MIVIVIIGAMMAVSMPKLKGTFQRGKLEAAARELTAVLRYARHTAVLRGDGCEVRIDPKKGTFQLALIRLKKDGTPIATEKATKKTGAYRLPTEVARLHTLPGNIYFMLLHTSAPRYTGSGALRILFYPDGSATATTIGLQDEQDRALHIKIYRSTGMTMVDKGKAELPPSVTPLFIRSKI